ncbi:MAG: O-antigen ligase family protein [Planctomycetota bacterium]
MSLTALVFWISYVSGICAAVFNPIVGLVLYILVYHLNPETQWWGETVRAVGLRLSFTAALATVIGLLTQRPRMPDGARQFPLTFILALMFGLIALGSLTWGLDVTPRGLYLVEKYGKLLIIMLIMIRCVRTPTHYHLVIMAWLVGTLYLGYEASGGAGHYFDGRLASGIGGPDFCESSGLSVHLVASLPLIGAMFFMMRSWWGRAFILATGAFVVNALVATRTRNALPGLAVVVVSGVLLIPRGYRIKAVVGVAVGSLLALQLTDPGWWLRMETITNYQADSSAMSRLECWGAGLRMVAEHPLGIGVGNFHYTVGDYIQSAETRALVAATITRSAHNTIVACLAETGWLGLALFLGIISLVIVRLCQVQKSGSRLPRQLGYQDVCVGRWTTGFHLGWHAHALRTALLGYLASAMFTTRLFSEGLWLLIGFSMCLRNVSQSLKIQGGRLCMTSTPQPADSVTPGLVVASEYYCRWFLKRWHQRGIGWWRRAGHHPWRRHPGAYGPDSNSVEQSAELSTTPGLGVIVVRPYVPDLDAPRATWELTGPDGYQYSGRSRRRLQDLQPGVYKLIWQEVDGWLTPPPEIQTLWADSTLEFATSYRRIPEIPARVIAQPAEINLGQGVTLSAVSAGAEIEWFTCAEGGDPIGTGRTINVRPGETTTYYAGSCDPVTGEVSPARMGVAVEVINDDLIDHDSEFDDLLSLLSDVYLPEEAVPGKESHDMDGFLELLALYDNEHHLMAMENTTPEHERD